MKIDINQFGGVNNTIITGDIGRLSAILKENNPERMKSIVQAKMEAVFNNMRRKYTIGLFGAVKRIILVDNLGGLDSMLIDTSRREARNGEMVVISDGDLLVDIDSLRNDAVLYDVVLYKLWEGILELVEPNPAVRKVVALYQNLKNFYRMPDREKFSLAGFLQNPDNGLDSEEYGDLLQFVLDSEIANNQLTNKQLILLAINYILTTYRYRHIREGLINVLPEHLRSAALILESTVCTYDDLKKAVNTWNPALQKIETAELISKTVMKFRMITSRMPFIGNDMISALSREKKYIRLDMDELIKPENKHIMVWLENLLKDSQERYPIILFSRSKKTTVTMLLNGYRGLDADKFLTDEEVKDKGIPRESIGTLFNLKNKKPGQEELQNTLCVPLLYSIVGIYLTAQVASAGGRMENINDNLTRSTLNAFYKPLFDNKIDWNGIFEGRIWPPIEKITEELYKLDDEIRKIESAA